LSAILAAIIVAAISLGIFGVGTPAPSDAAPLGTPPPDQNFAEPDVTFYVAAYHWDYAIFREDGSRLDPATVPVGTIVEIYAVNALAKKAVGKLPAPVVKAIGELPVSDPQVLLAAEPDLQERGFPETLDHGLLIASEVPGKEATYSRPLYLDNEAREPVRVVFTADQPGRYEFVCWNYCGAGHTTMTRRERLVVEPGVAPRTASLPVAGDRVVLGERIFTGTAEVLSISCATCHQIGRDATGPDLAGVATRAAGRVSGLTTEEYLRQSILRPQAYLVEGWPPVMPSFEGQMTEEQLQALIAYLMTLK
jgi:mono/diheme cytochrome c family protein